MGARQAREDTQSNGPETTTLPQSSPSTTQAPPRPTQTHFIKQEYVRIGVFSLSSDLVLQICVVGESGVGKSSLIHQWAEGQLSAVEPTQEIDFFHKSLTVEGKQVGLQIVSCKSTLADKLVGLPWR